MKKAVLLVAALVVCSSFAFADVTVGAWGRGLFIPAMGADEDITSIVQASWGGAPRIGMTISGKSDNVGFQVDFNGDGDAIGAGDQQKIWVKPIEMLTIQVGQIFDDTLRGNAVLGAWDWVRFNGMIGEDAVFGRVGVMGNVNAEISLAPVEGLYIFAAFGRGFGWDPAPPQDLKGTPALMEDMFKMGQYGAGYTIADIGQIRIQYIGEVGPDCAIINAAFKLTAVPGLTVDIGGAIPTDSDVALFDARIGVYASYAMDALTLHAAGQVTMFITDDLGFQVAAGVDYNLGNGLTLNAEGRYANEFDAMAAIPGDTGAFGLLLGVKMGFSNGLVGIAFEGTTGSFAGGGLIKTEADAFAWALPIRLEYWF